LNSYSTIKIKILKNIATPLNTFFLPIFWKKIKVTGLSEFLKASCTIPIQTNFY